MNHLDRELAALRARVADQDARLRRLPARLGVSAAKSPDRRLLIIGGQVVNGIDCIQYAASVTPAAAYDPNVTTAYPAGLGRAWLIEDGLAVSRVLVRHAQAAWRVPLIAGQWLRIPGTSSITYDPGGGGAVVTMTVYSVAW